MEFRVVVGGVVVLGLCAVAASLRADRLDCVPAQDSDLRHTDLAIRAALPGTDGYLPFPFPTTDAERIADLTHEIERWRGIQARSHVGASPWRLWARRAFDSTVDSGWHAAAEMGEAVGAHFLRGVLFYLPPIRDGKVRFSFESVADWTHVRCVYARARTWTVARVFDIATGTELSRVAMSEAGFYAAGRNSTSKSPLPAWPNAAAAVQRVAGRTGAALKAPILVRSFERCNDALLPCVAAESTDGSAVFVVRPSGEVFHVALRERLVFKSRDLLDAESVRAVQRALKPGEFLFALGPDVFGVAEPLAPAVP